MVSLGFLGFLRGSLGFSGVLRVSRISSGLLGFLGDSWGFFWFQGIREVSLRILSRYIDNGTYSGQESLIVSPIHVFGRLRFTVFRDKTLAENCAHVLWIDEKCCRNVKKGA